jgi:hypothetical protein
MEITSTVEPVQDGRIPVGEARQTHITARHGICDDIVGAMGAITSSRRGLPDGRTYPRVSLLFALHRTHNCIRKVTPSGELFALHESFEIGIDRRRFELSTRS